jgi:hypothetical protein
LTAREIKDLELEAEAIDLLTGLHRKFQATAAGSRFEADAVDRIAYVTFTVVKRITKPRGNEVLGGTKR